MCQDKFCVLALKLKERQKSKFFFFFPFRIAKLFWELLTGHENEKFPNFFWKKNSLINTLLS